MGHSMSSGPITGNIPISQSPKLMELYQLLQQHFKLGSATFQLQIINGCCTIVTNVEETVAAAWFFMTNSKVYEVIFSQNQTSFKNKIWDSHKARCAECNYNISTAEKLC